MGFFFIACFQNALTISYFSLYTIYSIDETIKRRLLLYSEIINNIYSVKYLVVSTLTRTHTVHYLISVEALRSVVFLKETCAIFRKRNLPQHDYAPKRAFNILNCRTIKICALFIYRFQTFMISLF